jgi:hypothetical protein
MRYYRMKPLAHEDVPVYESNNVILGDYSDLTALPPTGIGRDLFLPIVKVPHFEPEVKLFRLPFAGEQGAYTTYTRNSYPHPGCLQTGRKKLSARTWPQVLRLRDTAGGDLGAAFVLP